MASFLGFCFATLFILAITTSSPAATAAEEFKVGGDEGWRQPAPNDIEMYTRWASTKRFHVGDSLRFEYKNESLLVVDKWGYYHCNSTQPISVFDDGNTVVILDRPGPAYFVSSDPDHCKNGQRLIVDVISPHPISRSPMDASPAPSPFSGAGSFFAMPQLVLFYVFLVSASINNM